MLVVGSSLIVYSGFRFTEPAMLFANPIAAVDFGRTRADGSADPQSCIRIAQSLTAQYRAIGPA
jgi:hypothetical protein